MPWEDDGTRKESMLYKRSGFKMKEFSGFGEGTGSMSPDNAAIEEMNTPALQREQQMLEKEDGLIPMPERTAKESRSGGFTDEEKDYINAVNVKHGGKKSFHREFDPKSKGYAFPYQD